MSVAFESAGHSTLVTVKSRPDLKTEGLDVGSADTPMLGWQLSTQEWCPPKYNALNLFRE